MTAADPRLTPARADLAAERLRGAVEAARYAAPMPMSVVAPVAPLMRRPENGRGLDTQLLFGEPVEIYDVAGGWAWGQSVLDGYVGYLPASALGPEGPAPTHRIAAPASHLYAEPDIKTVPQARLSLGARVAVAERVAAKGTSGEMVRLATGGYLYAAHLEAIDRPAADWVAVAERLVGSPYLWGGRSAEGIDCSGLVQLAMQAGGRDCPRDTDMQEGGLGETLPEDAALRRGDLVFWRGHLGIMQDGDRLLHANAYHMAVASEALADAAARIERNGGGPVTRCARLDASPGSR